MKRILVVVLALLICSAGYSQIPKRQSLKEFSTWSITPNAAVSFGNMDIKENDPFYKRTNYDVGYGAELSKQLSHFASIQLNYFTTDIKADVNQLSYKTRINQLDFRLRLNITNGFILRNWSSTQLYGYLGYGVLDYHATQYRFHKNDSLVPSSGTTRVVPVGVGFKYRLGNRTSISADLSYNGSNSDKLDTWANPLTSKDGYTKFTIGFTYNLGSKKILEWDNPYVYLVPDEVHDTTVVIHEYKAPAAVAVAPIDSAVIYYVPGSWSIEFPYLEDLDKVIARAKKNKYSIEITSYCDATGSSKTNLEVIGKRAGKVYDYVAKFIPETNIAVGTFDETHALYAPEARNRRVVVKIIK